MRNAAMAQLSEAANHPNLLLLGFRTCRRHSGDHERMYGGVPAEGDIGETPVYGGLGLIFLSNATGTHLYQNAGPYFSESAEWRRFHATSCQEYAGPILLRKRLQSNIQLYIPNPKHKMLRSQIPIDPTCVKHKSRQPQPHTTLHTLKPRTLNSYTLNPEMKTLNLKHLNQKP